MGTQLISPLFDPGRKFPGETEEKLLDRLAEVNEELSSGKYVTSVGSGGATSAQQAFRSFKKVQSEILHDLNILDPAKYPKTVRVNKTRARFN